MIDKKEARFDIIFQGAGKGESNDISFQFSGATLSDAVFSSATTSAEHSNGELGGRYNYYDIENAVFYPTKERLERETRRIFGTAPDTVNFSLIEFPEQRYLYKYNSFSEWRTYWYTEGISSSPPPPEQFWKQVVEITEDNRYKVRTWERMEVFRNTALPGSGIALHQTYYYESYYNTYSDFDKMMADGFSEYDWEPESPGQTLTDMVFSPLPESVSYKSYMPYPYKVGQYYGIERDTGTGKSLMAVWWGDTYTRVRELALTPAFVLEQPLVSMSCPRIEGLEYIRSSDRVKWKDWIRESNAEVWNVGFAENIPGAEFITEEFGTAIETHYWKGCSNASLSGFLNTNSEIWSGTGKAVAKTTDDGFQSFYSVKVLTDSLINRSEIAFSFDSNNNDEGKYDSATIKYIFLFRADGSVDFVTELPTPVTVPRGCSFDLTTTIDHTPEVLII